MQCWDWTSKPWELADVVSKSFPHTNLAQQNSGCAVLQKSYAPGLANSKQVVPIVLKAYSRAEFDLFMNRQTNHYPIWFKDRAETDALGQNWCMIGQIYRYMLFCHGHCYEWQSNTSSRLCKSNVADCPSVVENTMASPVVNVTHKLSIPATYSDSEYRVLKGNSSIISQTKNGYDHCLWAWSVFAVLGDTLLGYSTHDFAIQCPLVLKEPTLVFQDHQDSLVTIDINVQRINMI